MTLPPKADADTTPLDDAARAGWLYFVGGKTQDQIARDLGISRQRAQRLVSKAMSEGLIHMRLDHKTAACLDLEAQLKARFNLNFARVAIGLGDGIDPVGTVAPAAAAEIERVLAQPEPQIIGLGTGRMLRAAAEGLRTMDCPQHKLVSLIGNISPDGTASFFDVIMRIAAKVQAPHFPMPLPVIASTVEERAAFLALAPVQRARDLAKSATVIFVGVGEMTGTPPVVKDGFLSLEELAEMQAAGAAGEICSLAYNADGEYLTTGHNQRVTGVEVEPESGALVVGVAAGPAKVRALHAALKGKILNALVTDEATATALLQA